ncbi:hypothetical protein BD779DRAFT_1432758 [Infundibulicybe gibba]|nr:hypothetical protein BD779DRAFT_1432758 [Infundibulicybe gibba]
MQRLREQELAQLKEQERLEAEKKKHKFIAFENKPLTRKIARRPSPWALSRLEKGQYVPLWYFTPEGCKDAQATMLSAHEESLDMSQVDGKMTLKPTAGARASRNAIDDSALSWEQMCSAKNAFLVQIQATGWPEIYISSLASFFLDIECHELRDEEFGKPILLNYQARMRREWHDTLDRNKDTFDIGMWSSSVMEAVSNDYWNQSRMAGIKEVSNILNYLTYTPSSPPPPLFPNSNPCISRDNTRAIILPLTSITADAGRGKNREP